MNVRERLWESTFITSSTDKNSNSVLSCETADRPEPLGRYGSLPQDPAGVKMVDDVLWWWVWISGEEWFWGTTWGGGYPLKDARPWLDPCTAGESAPAKTKPAVERRIEIRIPQVTLPLLMSSFNHEWDEMRWELNDVWRQWTCVKRRIGATNCSKKLIKNRKLKPYQQDRETLELLSRCRDRESRMMSREHWGESLPESVQVIEDNKR